MSERTLGQMSFADRLVADVSRGNATLERIDALVDWAVVKELLGPLRSGPMGAPGYPALAMLKALLLQQWYGLSDPGLEEAKRSPSLSNVRYLFRRQISSDICRGQPLGMRLQELDKGFRRPPVALRVPMSVAQEVLVVAPVSFGFVEIDL